MSYPLHYVPPYPGPKPPRWRFRARRRWESIMVQRNLAKKWNFGRLYGSGVAINCPSDAIIFEDMMPWTRDAYEQMFHRSVPDRTHKPTTRE